MVTDLQGNSPFDYLAAIFYRCPGIIWQWWLQIGYQWVAGSQANYYCWGIHQQVSVLAVWCSHAWVQLWSFVLCHSICERGLKDDIRAVVEPQVPTTMERIVVIVKIQQKVVDRSKLKYQQKQPNTKVQQAKPKAKTPFIYGNLWRDK